MLGVVSTVLRRPAAARPADPSPQSAPDPFAEARSAADRARDERRWSEAAGFYRAALDIQESPGLRVQLAHMLKEARDFSAAEIEYFRALEVASADVDLHVQIGHFYWVAGDAARSLEFYEKARALAPDDPEVALHAEIGKERLAAARTAPIERRAYRLMDQHRWREAEPLLRELIEAGMPQLQLILGHALKDQGQLERAVEVYSRHRDWARETGRPEEALDAEVHMARCYKIMRRFSEAASLFAQARQTRLEIEGWYGSTDDLLTELTTCMRKAHPCIQVQLR